MILLQVTDIKPVPDILAHVAHLEVIPLEVPPRVGVHPQVQIVLQLPHLDHAVQIGGLEEGVEDQGVGLQSVESGVLAAEGPVCEFHVRGGLEVRVGELERHLVPGVESVVVPGPEVTYDRHAAACALRRFALEAPFCIQPVDPLVQVVEDRYVVGDWDRVAATILGHPTKHRSHEYPVAISGYSEYFLELD